jgi:hypothetical protein
MTTYVNTTFIITNNQSTYTPASIWVSFSGSFSNTGVAQTIGTTTITDFSSTWQSFNISDLTASVAQLPYFSSPQYTFSLNGFSGRIYINFGTSALTTAPNPGNPGSSPYIVFETTVLGETMTTNPPPPSASNIDLSYVDGISSPAATMICNADTGAAIAATSVNPVSSTAGIMANVTALVPGGAAITNNDVIVRIMSSAAAPSVYHDWTQLMTALQTTTANSPLNVCSYTSPATGAPASYSLNGALFGYSGAPAISGQAANFETMQNYVTTATFTANMNPDNDPVLSSFGISNGTAGVIISGSGAPITGGGTPAGSFSIFITQTDLNAVTGIYGNNPAYVVYPQTGTAYQTNGIVNDLGGRIVGDLMAGMVFGWSASAINITTQASATNTNLYGWTPSVDTMDKLSTGELFYLLSLAGAQGKLTDWIGSSLDNNPNHYDPYLYAIAANSYAYGSGFTDRLQGYANPDTYWYTANPPAMPGGTGNYELAGFVNLYLGSI